ncbi:hypothetical protein GALL_208810 [mine drainage metagenome]|uniref:Uncharacterized protein n=1 Tax=mine drainage metagenome TaxID=410659 RepID=A0A1J5RLH8_9ZZZZ
MISEADPERVEQKATKGTKRLEADHAGVGMAESTREEFDPETSFSPPLLRLIPAYLIPLRPLLFNLFRLGIFSLCALRVLWFKSLRPSNRRLLSMLTRRRGDAEKTDFWLLAPALGPCELRIDIECGISIPLSDASLDSRPPPPPRAAPPRARQPPLILSARGKTPRRKR